MPVLLSNANVSLASKVSNKKACENLTNLGCRQVSVRALYDFMGHESENEMSFTRGAIITNVREEDKPW